MTNRSQYTQAGQALQTQHDARTSPALKMRAFLDARAVQIAKWVRGGVRPEALIRFAMMDMSTNAKLAACTPDSLYLGLLACAVSGLEPGALKGECFLVPFSGKAQFMVGWKGIVKQARRSREVTGLVANVVRERDEFAVDLGTENSIIHRPSLGLSSGSRGEVIGAYAIATMTGGHREIELLDAEDLKRIRAVADKRGPSPAWKDWPDQMSRKSALRRLGKRLPLGDDYYIAAAIDNAAEDGKEQKDVIDMVTDGAASMSDAQLANVPPMEDAQPGDEYAFDPEAVQ